MRCNGPCSEIDIELEDTYCSWVDLYADSTCAECEPLCSNEDVYVHKKICKGITTTSDTFFVTVYANGDHDKLDITFKGGNLRNVTNFGK